MTPQEANPAGHARAETQSPFAPSMTPGPDDRRRSYGRRVGDRFPGREQNAAVEMAKGIVAIAAATFTVSVLLMVAIWLFCSLF